MASESNPVSMSAPAYSMLGRASDDLDRESSSFDLIDEEAPLRGDDEPARGGARVAVPRPAPPSAARRGPRSTTTATATAAERLAREQSEKERRFAQLRSQGRRDSLGFVQDKHGQLLIPDDPITRDPGERARKRERCCIAVLCWTAFGAVYAAACLLMLDSQEELPPVWPRRFDVRTFAYSLVGGAALLVGGVLLRTMRIEKTWVPCFALASCARQTGCSYLAYGALCTALMLTLPYIAWVSYVRVQQLKPHIVAWVFSSVFSGLAIILSAHTIQGHLKQYSAPRLQRYIVRILLLVPIYAGCSCAETVYPGVAVYLTTFRELYEAYTLFNFIRCVLPRQAQDTDRSRFAKTGSGHNRLK